MWRLTQQNCSHLYMCPKHFPFPGSPGHAPKICFQITQFSGNFEGKTPILSTFWAQGPHLGQNSTAPHWSKSWIHYRDVCWDVDQPAMGTNGSSPDDFSQGRCGCVYTACQADIHHVDPGVFSTYQFTKIKSLRFSMQMKSVHLHDKKRNQQKCKVKANKTCRCDPFGLTAPGAGLWVGWANALAWLSPKMQNSWCKNQRSHTPSEVQQRAQSKMQPSIFSRFQFCLTCAKRIWKYGPGRQGPWSCVMVPECAKFESVCFQLIPSITYIVFRVGQVILDCRTRKEFWYFCSSCAGFWNEPVWITGDLQRAWCLYMYVRTWQFDRGARRRDNGYHPVFRQHRPRVAHRIARHAWNKTTVLPTEQSMVARRSLLVHIPADSLFPNRLSFFFPEILQIIRQYLQYLACSSSNFSTVKALPQVSSPWEQKNTTQCTQSVGYVQVRAEAVTTSFSI